MKKLIELIILFMTGGAAYFVIETLWRGYSHWLMFMIGGISFILIGLINEVFSWKIPIEIQSIIGGLIITGIEFITGLIANIHFHMDIWDYSTMPLNIMG